MTKKSHLGTILTKNDPNKDVGRILTKKDEKSISILSQKITGKFYLGGVSAPRAYRALLFQRVRLQGASSETPPKMPPKER